MDSMSETLICGISIFLENTTWRLIRLRKNFSINLFFTLTPAIVYLFIVDNNGFVLMSFLLTFGLNTIFQVK